MTGTAWLGIAAALGVLGPTGALPARVTELAAVGRLAEPPPANRHVAALTVSRIVAAASILGVVVLLMAGTPLLAAAAGAAVGTGATLRRDAVRRRERSARHAELCGAVRVLIGELESGARAADALGAAGDVAPRYAATFAAAASVGAVGGDAGAALLDDAGTRPIGLAWHVAADTGLALAGVLGRVGDDLRAEQDQRRAVEAALAGPRASALLLSGLPLVGIALGTTMGARPIAVLTGTRAGQVLCCAGVLFDALGVLWMRRILARAERT
jgi:tight adherence protein B